MTLSSAERSLVARLVRLHREPKYWLRYYVEWLLHMDATSAGLVSVTEVELALEAMKNFVNWIGYFDEVCKKNPALADYPGLDWIPSDQPEDDCDIRPVTEASFSRKEQLEAELREIKAQLISPRATMFREAAAEYARRVGETLQRMKDDDEGGL